VLQGQGRKRASRTEAQVVLFGCFSKRLQLIRALPVLALYNKK
jgi:hypothetical protein